MAVKHLPAKLRTKLKTETRLNGGKMNPNGVILYRGKSQLNDAPIVAIMTGIANPSSNPKTGKMYQIYILVDNGKTAVENHRTGADFAVCGDCPLRGKYDANGEYIKGTRVCYVNLGHAPHSIMNCLNAGGYADISSDPDLITELCTGHYIRGGSYGDPAAVLAMIWQLCFEAAASHTAYTHQWAKLKFSYLRQYAMASVDTASQALGAAASGWRYFRLDETSQKLEGQKEVVCPNTTVGLECSECKACSGLTGGRTASVVIPVHGSGAAAFNAAA